MAIMEIFAQSPLTTWPFYVVLWIAIGPWPEVSAASPRVFLLLRVAHLGESSLLSLVDELRVSQPLKNFARRFFRFFDTHSVHSLKLFGA